MYGQVPTDLKQGGMTCDGTMQGMQEGVWTAGGCCRRDRVWLFHFCVCCCVERVWKRMLNNPLHKAAKRGDVDEVERLVDEEGVEVESKDEVRVCLCVLLAHLGAVWDSGEELLFLGLLTRATWT